MIDNTKEALELDKRLNSMTKKQKAHENKKPRLDKYEDAVTVLDDGTRIPLFDVGDDIIIERYAACLSTCPWLDTRQYTVMEINDETGDLHLWNNDTKLRFMGNYITGPIGGDVYKRALVKPKKVRRTKKEKAV